MKKITTTTLMIILFSLTLNAQNDFEMLWTKVEKLEVQNLPKSALKIVDEIYEKADKSNNSSQIIKSLFYQSKFSLILEENAQLKVINNFKKHIDIQKSPTKNVLQNVLANLYWQYFNQNRYKFYNRTKTSEKVDANDFRTWDLNTLFKEIHLYFNASLENEETLKNIDIEAFSDILLLQKETKTYRPTLFDFLANNALQFYKSSETSITRPSYKFNIDDSKYLKDFNAYSDLKITSKDSISLQLNALKIYQKLICHHLTKDNTDALVHIDIERLTFVKNNAIFDDKNAIFLNTLKKSEQKFINQSANGLYAFEIAKIYKNESKNKDALDICNSIIKQFPNSFGAQNCKILKAQIKHKTLAIRAEEFTPINKNSRVLVTYKNIEKLFFTAYNITQKEFEQFNERYNFEDKKNFINALEISKTWKHQLRNEGDYLQHATEVIVPKFENGMYLIVASETQDLQENTIYGTTTFQATNLTLVENTFNDKYNYQVVDRNTGKPIHKAKIHLKNKVFKNLNHINKKLVTNKNGFASFKSDERYTNVDIAVKIKNDFAIFGNHYFYEYSRTRYTDNQDEEITIKPFIFTDRSIYRPGQTVYFKAIVIKKQGDKSEAFTNEYVSVTLTDVNNQEVKELDLKLNEFGSVAGEFIIPNNGLTGEFEIKIDESVEYDSKFYDDADFDFDYNSSTRIQVEEYKRSKFETEFKPIIESYKINDSVTVNGFAKAFSGANITDAKVVYRVHRKVQYPSWYYWRIPNANSSSQEITQGEITTNEKGEFKITFKAIPDESVDKASLPVFNYEITADVTDVNGETRSATTIVKVGYHSLIASISVPDKIDKSNKETIISIDTKNLNDEFVAAKGNLKIYKLQSPKNPLRKRPWSAPDYQDISENTFRKLFPNDPYTNDESDEKNWKKGELVFSKNFDTETSKEIKLLKTKNWISGKYVIILESKDKFNQAVKDEKRVTLFSSKETKIADSKLFTINTDKTFYQIDDTIKLQIGSASKDISVVVQIEKNHKIVDTKIIRLSNNTKTIQIPVTKKDLGGFAIKYHFVNYNYFKSGNLIIDVPHQPKNDINITTNIFRDKLQPGAKETWSFTIKDDKNDAVASELLASMYDASLDEFKSHSWSFNPITTRRVYNSYKTSNANNSFGNINFRTFNLRRNYFGFPKIQNDAYNWFGFSLNNSKWKNQQYVRNVRLKINNTRKDFDGIITGTIRDSSGVLPGVSILIKGTNFGTETNFDGNYSIKIKKGDVLVFRYLGFKTKEFLTDNQTNIDVVLQEDPNLLEEVVITGYGTKKFKFATSAVSTISQAEYNADFSSILNGQVAGVSIVNSSGQSGANSLIRLRGVNSIKENNKPLYIVDGVIVDSFDENRSNIVDISILKDASANAIYGSRGSNGVVIITTKSGQEKLDKELSKVKARKNFKETAFFYPQLKTDKNGKVSFTFTMPEALTRWKLQLLAHTKDLKSASKTLQTVTQKELMIVPNAPRFLREKDTITLSAKITNLTNNPLSGFAKLILTDAISGKEINQELQNSNSNKNFTVDKDGNTNVSWNLSISKNIQAVQYKIVAKAGDFSDGEQNVLPVLSNRMLVTETLPMWVGSNRTKTFTLNKLQNNTSSTLQNHKLTLEMTSNPAWYAIQALPYLMEYPYECAEQTFSKYYANTLASFVANSNLKIQEVFNSWRNSDALLSNLEKNQELKSMIIQETPWLRDAKSETEQKKRIALLFDLNKMKNQQQKAINKLKDMQLNSGGFSWFKGGRYASNFITQHIATGFGHLQKLGVPDFDKSTQKMIEKAVKFLDDELLEQYEKLLDRAEKIKQNSKTKKEADKKYKEYLSKNNLGYFTIQYLYMRSFYIDIAKADKLKTAVDYYQNQSIKYWNDYNLYAKGQIALSLFRNDKKQATNNILKSLKENSITSDELGMYWKSNTAGYYYYQAPVETQALMIEVFSEIENDVSTIDNLKIWLLKNKQTNSWKTTKATSEAVYALLLNGSDWISSTEMVDIKVGNQNINPSEIPEIKVEAGTGYFKTSWNTSEITSEMAKVTITKKDKGIAWGGLYWQYFEDLDKISSAETPLKLNKKLFKKINSDTGKELQKITKETDLKIGDLITVRIEIHSDRDMEFIHLKDMRASGVEPINVLSKYKWQDNLGYYESTKDAATNFFFDRLPKGVYVFEYDVRVNNAGNFSNGISTIQSMYAPEFSSHSEGVRIKVD
ncbi:MG2 domain-containing protein [Polaribacter porphyrae]|uniref:Alpha-2-macroglobulin n=1 Tax=Polaribacter porphyrae TaxID=1137780 RepID=A0A2S7WNQ9_9FLAO|nr:MG2 domain-containing protein [Polaribacter porphyrae]PQJ79239.1 alpha-2-macroglobulin [Polaribacter porphyrae]